MMKKLILVFAICMAFAVKSFAYTGHGYLQLNEVGSQGISQDMTGATGMDYQMGATIPGYISITLYDAYGNKVLSDSCECDFLGNGDSSSGVYLGPLGGLNVVIYVYEIGGSSQGNGIYFTWSDGDY